jgi:hypothetical protein
MLYRVAANMDEGVATVRNLLLLAVLLHTALFAQEFRGTISGAVLDAQSSRIPKARIEAMEMRTGVRSVVVSDNAGKYVIPFLAPGTYQITAIAAGFKRFIQDNFILETSAHPVLDIHLEVGDVSQSVSISAEAPLIETGQRFRGRADHHAAGRGYPAERAHALHPRQSGHRSHARGQRQQRRWRFESQSMG